MLAEIGFFLLLIEACSTRVQIAVLDRCIGSLYFGLSSTKIQRQNTATNDPCGTTAKIAVF
jgi:hypothetical protein